MNSNQFLYYTCLDATLKTSDGVGLATLVGNVNITECDNIRGDSQVNGNSSIQGNSIVQGDVTMIGNVVGNNNMYVPTVNATNIYQPLNFGPTSDTNNLTLTQNTTGTYYFINPITINVLPFSYNFPNNPRVGTNYKFIVNNTFGSSSLINFITSQTIIGSYYYSVSSITGYISNPHPQTIGTPSFEDPDYTVNNANITVNPSVGEFIQNQSVSTSTFSLTTNNLRIGDNLSFIYNGTNWMIAGILFIQTS